MQHPFLLATGVALLVIGFVLMRWAGRYDVTGLAADAAWRMVKTRSATGMKDELGRVIDEQLTEVRADAARMGLGRTAIKHGGRFLLARFVNIAGIIMMLVGAGLGAAAFFI